ncbi:MAG: prepilin-type N-terminal cleavage/methylation domain-containing protein [Verrucomicrobiota bacterium]|nr:prepilin-type N-terminal cleavage/methylation domain-containing protein [Verrucomicrobiota bacterium]
MIQPKNQTARAFTLSEVMVATLIFSAVSLGLMMGFTSLERCFAATTDFATNHSDQMRISDYLALDLRRALSVQATQNDTTIFIPRYYDNSGAPQTPTLNGQGGVLYGASGDSVRVRYYLSGSTIYREQANWPLAVTPATSTIAVAENVKDFIFDVTDLGKVVTSRITFNPTFRSGGATAAATAATAFYNTTLLRNTRTDTGSSVY